MEPSSLIATIGVSFLLLAFFLNIFKILEQTGWSYLLLNFTGATIACYASWLIDFIPFVVLEGTWAAVAAFAIGRKISQ